MKKRLPVQNGRRFCFAVMQRCRADILSARAYRITAALAAHTASASVCWICHSSNPGRPMGTPSRRKVIPLSSSVLQLAWNARAPGRAARSSSMTAAFTPAPISTSGPSSSSRRRSSAASWENAPCGNSRHRRSSAPCRCRVPPQRGRWRTDRGKRRCSDAA